MPFILWAEAIYWQLGSLAVTPSWQHQGVGDRVGERNYSWSAVGENIAAGQNSVAQVVDGWLSSPGHCANIMRAEFTEMGAARIEAPGSKYSPFMDPGFCPAALTKLACE